MTTSVPFYAFGLGPSQSGTFGASPLGCTVGSSYTGGLIWGYCGFATGVGNYGWYLWVGGILVKHFYDSSYGVPPAFYTPNHLGPYHVREGIYVIAPSVIGNNTCGVTGGATNFAFVGAGAHSRCYFSTCQVPSLN